MFLAVDLAKYHPEKPQIAQAVSIIDNDNIEVLWYCGTWSGPWKVYKRREGRNMVESKEVIPKSSVKLFNFTFTQGGKLKQAVKDQLRALYSTNKP